MDTILIKAAQLILAFAILVIIHEFGHFLFARIFGIRVEKFYIFFDPWIEIFKWKPKKYYGFFGKTKKGLEPLPDDAPEKKESLPECENDENTQAVKGRKKFWGDTEYGIGWLPLGGYCKISGMIDESMDKEQMQKPAQPWEFRSKPAWQRLLVMVGGVLFNFLFAILIYAGIVYATGENYVKFSEAKMGMTYSPAALKVGFQNGDIPLYADGEALDHPGEGRLKILQASNVRVLRNGKDTVNISLPEDFIFRIDEESKKDDAVISLMTYRIPAQVTTVSPGEGADKAGIRAGDVIASVNNKETPDLFSFLSALDGHPDETVSIGVVRDGKREEIPVRLSDNSKMGVALQTDPSAFYKAETKNYGLLESVPRGVELGVDRLSSYAGSLKYMFTKEGAKSIGGFGAIGSIFPEKWDWIAFWNIAAFLSVALAVMNILPIPALDGGHVLFLLYEVVTRRKPSLKFMEYAQITGMAIIILLLVYANGMDVLRLFR